MDLLLCNKGTSQELTFKNEQILLPELDIRMIFFYVFIPRVFKLLKWHDFC